MPIPMMFDWGETKASLWFSFRVPAANAINTDIQISRHYMKVNKSPHFFECDFYDEIDFSNTKNSTKFEGGNVFVMLMKGEGSKYMWNSFKLAPGQKFGPANDMKPGLTAGQLRDRRIASEKELLDYKQQVKIDQEKTKLGLNQAALDQQWKAEREIKQSLADKKQAEKDAAIEAIHELEREEKAQPVTTAPPAPTPAEPTPAPHVKSKYEPDVVAEEADSDDDESFTAEQKQAKEEKRRAELAQRKVDEERRETERRAATEEAKKKVREQEEKERKLLQEKLRSGENIELAPMNAARQARIDKKGELPPVRQVDDINGGMVETVLKEVGGLRVTADPNSIISNYKPDHVANSTTIKVSMTKKMFPNVPTREQHVLQQPMPKSGAAQLSGGGKDDETNPIWLKEKADQMYRVGDFKSAVSAYESVVEMIEAKAVEANQSGSASASSNGGQNAEWIARVLSNKSECLIHIGEITTAKKDLSSAIHRLTVAAQARSDHARNSQTGEASSAVVPSGKDGILGVKPAVMDASTHRLWASLRARQAHVALLSEEHNLAEAFLVDALEVPEALGDQLHTNLSNSLFKLREGIKFEAEKKRLAAASSTCAVVEEIQLN